MFHKLLYYENQNAYLSFALEMSLNICYACVDAFQRCATEWEMMHRALIVAGCSMVDQAIEPIETMSLLEMEIDGVVIWGCPDWSSDVAVIQR